MYVPPSSLYAPVKPEYATLSLKQLYKIRNDLIEQVRYLKFVHFNDPYSRRISKDPLVQKEIDLALIKIDPVSTAIWHHLKHRQKSRKD